MKAKSKPAKLKNLYNQLSRYKNNPLKAANVEKRIKTLESQKK